MLAGLMLPLFLGVVLGLFALLLRSGTAALTSAGALGCSLFALFWLRRWRVEFYEDRVQCQTLFSRRALPYEGLRAEIRRRPGPRFVKTGSWSPTPLLVLRRGRRVELSVSFSQAGAQTDALLGLLKTLPLPKAYL